MRATLLLLLVALSHQAFIKRIGPHEILDLDIGPGVKTIGANRFIHHFEADNGLQKTQLRYDVTVVDAFVSLDSFAGIESIDCQRDSVTVRFSEEKFVTLWEHGKLIAGGAQWLCLGENGNPAAFYRKVLSTVSTGPLEVEVRTENKTFVDCFLASDIDLVHSPSERSNLTKRIEFDKTFSFNLWANRQEYPIIKSDPRFFKMAGNSDFVISAGLQFAVVTQGIVPSVKLFKVRTFAKAEYSLSMTTLAGFAWSYTKKLPIFSQTLPPFAFSIGPVPISITPRLSLEMQGSLGVTDQVKIFTGLKYSYEFSVGTIYTDVAGFQPFIDAPTAPTFTVTPPTLTVTRKAVAKLSIVPKITLLLWDVVPFSATVTPYIAASVDLETAKCSPNSPYFSITTGVDYAIALEPLQFLGQKFAFKGILPLTFPGKIVPEKELYGSCWLFASQFTDLPLYYWRPKPWGVCSTMCGNGTQTRQIECATFVGNVVPDNKCEDLKKPETTKACSYPCNTCAYSTCGTCLRDHNCYWCTSSSKCLASDSNATCTTPAAFACPDEPDIVVTSPSQGESWDTSKSQRISWTGGPAGGEVFIFFTWDSGSTAWYNGAGIPETPVPNTGSFNWTLPAGIPSTNKYRVAVISARSSDNMGISKDFNVNGRCVGTCTDNVIVKSAWSACSAICGAGNQTRTFTCYSPSQTVANPNLCAPVDTIQPCTTDCQDDYPVRLVSPDVGEQYQGGTKLTVRWTGGSPNNKVKIEYKLPSSQWVQTGLPATVDNNGNFEWTVPNNLQSSLYYQFRVTSARNAANADVSGAVMLAYPVVHQLVLRVHSASEPITTGYLLLTIDGLTGSIGPVQWNAPFTPGMVATLNVTNNYIGPILRATLSLGPTVPQGARFEANELTVTQQDGAFRFGMRGLIPPSGNITRATCSNVLTCDNCVEREGCGWCGDKCTPGTLANNAEGTCADSWIPYQATTCPKERLGESSADLLRSPVALIALVIAAVALF